MVGGAGVIHPGRGRLRRTRLDRRYRVRPRPAGRTADGQPLPGAPGSLGRRPRRHVQGQGSDPGGQHKAPTGSAVGASLMLGIGRLRVTVTAVRADSSGAAPGAGDRVQGSVLADECLSAIARAHSAASHSSAGGVRSYRGQEFSRCRVPGVDPLHDAPPGSHVESRGPPGSGVASCAFRLRFRRRRSTTHSFWVCARTARLPRSAGRPVLPTASGPLRIRPSRS